MTNPIKTKYRSLARRDLWFVTIMPLCAALIIGPAPVRAADAATTQSDAVRQVFSMDFGWKFALGDPASAQAPDFNGLALAIVQATNETGTIHLTASSPGLAGADLTIDVKPPEKVEAALP